MEITGEAPKYDGWRFLGTLQHGDGGNILRTVPGETIPEEYRHVIPTCDHCKSKRRRKDTFVVQHDDGTVKQVGRQCIKDFLGHTTIEHLGWIATLEKDIETACVEDEDRWYGSRGPTYVDTETLLIMVSACIRLHGWKSRSSVNEYGGIATVSRALDELYPPPKYQQEVFPTEEDEKMATDALAWARSLGEREGLSDYLGNCCVISKKEALEWRDTGIAASIISTYQREIGKLAERKTREEARQKEKESQYFGTPGKREVFTLTVVDVYTWDTMYGAKTMYKFIDQAGNVATWKTSFIEGAENDRGRTWKIKATVKEHSEFRDVKQTVLTRCTWEEELKPAS